ncbi:hypothetical protein LGKMAHEF_03721 [Aeromonas salmonicida]|nr:hypothetical protein [Aeromonas salmonicida]SPT66049.1 adenylate cyclase [Aeromonas salmonicida]SUU73034.1 adenylate cyclase [Aeromonas salmonicida]
MAGLGKPLALQLLPEPNESDAKARITLGLQHWQHHEQYWLEQADPEQRRLALQEIRQSIALVIEAAGMLVAPTWLDALIAQSAHLALLAQDVAEPEWQMALSALFHRADYVRLQLAIAAWLHATA